ncbi:MAG: hypothetical protein HYS87_01135 [Candidatus Colwellbacteria bacterium]|nr:hypothetical protein [Candidatus Colwellbacteria bacterium]
MQKNTIVLIAILVLVAAAIYYLFFFKKQSAPATLEDLTTPSILAPIEQNPASDLPDTNPLRETNPFTQTYQNPFNE